MTIAQIKTLVKKGESEVLEFKNSTSSLTSGMQTICAFLNSDQGGKVIFGISDKGEITGQDVKDKTLKDISIEINRIEPQAKIKVKYLTLKNKKKIILFDVNPGDKAPYTYDGRPYSRNQSTTRRMSSEEYSYLYNQNNPTLWERLTTDEFTLRDLDRNLIKQVVRVGVTEKKLPESALGLSIPDILKKLKLTVGDKLTNAAVVLFCKDEFKQLIQSNIKMARFKGINKTEFINMKAYTGNAFSLYDKAMEFLEFTIPLAAKIEEGKVDRVETPAIPYTVLREAVINALIHRDYSYAGGSLAVAVYDDRVNISNFGALPKGIMLNQLSKEHPSVPRNPLIAHVFYLHKKIEKWGRGTLDMIIDCKSVGNPVPKYEEVGGTFSLTLPFKEPIRGTTVTEVKPLDLSRLTQRQRDILKVLENGPLSGPQVKSKMNIDMPDRTLQWELLRLKEIGLVKSEGKTKSTVWLINFDRIKTPQ